MIDEEMMYQTIRAVVMKKRLMGIHPDLATSREVAEFLGIGTAVVEDFAWRLLNAGRIAIGQGLNYDYYRISDDAKTD